MTIDDIAASPAPSPTPPMTDRSGPRWRRAARALRRWYGWLLIVVAALWLGYNVVRRVTTGRWHWSILLDAVPPVFLVAVPLLLLGLSAAACGPRRRWAAALALAGLLPGIDQTGVNLHALRPGDRPVPASAVHVVSWNTNYWGMSNDDPQAQLRFLKRLDADVYLLQEHVIWVPGTGEVGYHPIRDDARLQAEFPGYHIVRRSELVTISRFPVVATPLFGPAAQLPPDAPFNQVFSRDKVLRTDLLVGDSTVSVYNVHVTVPTAIDLSILRPQVDPDAYFRRKFDWRQAEVQGLVDDLQANPNPSIISGDFNATSSMGTLDPLRAVAEDATTASRHLLPMSWRFNAPMTFQWDNPLAGLPLPFWRIDWTFTAGPVTVHRYELASAEYLSDHRPQHLWFSVG
ncbi:endonuclease/exonuclease/phosphatase family protein [Micromonospora sp. LOL_021]|uniref:endonuclease/exonuclease/phosphatase family protein n=1 Tax=Micromonospora sp. LOL_021 TaxID=3345417 RepID=UPI003A884162